MPYQAELNAGRATAHKKILKEITGPLASHYLNEVVGAVCTTLIDTNKMSTAIGLIEDSKLVKTEYF